MQDNNKRAIKYIVFFIILAIAVKYIVNCSDEYMIIIPSIGVVTFAVLDLYAPCVVIENKTNS